MKSKHLLSGIVIVLVISLIPVTPGAAGKVGYINLQRLVNESDLGKSAREDLLKLRRNREDALVEKLNEVNGLKQIINDQGSAMSPQEKMEKLEALQKAHKEYQRMVADAKEDIVREDRQLVSIILGKADPVLKQVAQKKKYTIILKDPNAIGYLDPDVDITNDVLKELNKN